MRPKPARPWPRTLWGQTLATTVITLFAAQVLTLILFQLLVVRPELQRVARTTAQNVAAVSELIGAADPAERAILIRHLGQTGWIELWQGQAPPDDSGPRPRMTERIFMRALVEAMGDRSDLYWRTDRRRRLWLQVHFGPDPYWISVRSPPRNGPTGLMLMCLLISGAMASVVAWVVTSRVLRPLHALKTASETLTLSALPDPVSEDGPDDVAAVSRSFNLMTQRLKQADADRSLVLAGISHDVRTPLAKLKLAFAMMNCDDDDLRTSAERQIDTIDRILSQFLTFARGFDAETVGRVEVRDLLSELAQARAGVILGDIANGDLVGRIEAVRRAVANLVENALRYGRVPVVISAIRHRDSWAIGVRDHGLGIAPDQLESIKNPFVRGDAARTADGGGTGLGLAIADRVARLHGGRLDLRNLPDGFEAVIILADTEDLPKKAGLP